jgi:hypothetical protein
MITIFDNVGNKMYLGGGGQPGKYVVLPSQVGAAGWPRDVAQRFNDDILGGRGVLEPVPTSTHLDRVETRDALHDVEKQLNA